jgi:hypothetical protein
VSVTSGQPVVVYEGHAGREVRIFCMLSLHVWRKSWVRMKLVQVTAIAVENGGAAVASSAPNSLPLSVFAAKKQPLATCVHAMIGSTSF